MALGASHAAKRASRSAGELHQIGGATAKKDGFDDQIQVAMTTARTSGSTAMSASSPAARPTWRRWAGRDAMRSPVGQALPKRNP